VRNYAKKSGFRYDLIIINNSTLSVNVTSNMTDFTVPIFSVNQAIFDSLKILDVKTEVGNYITNITYKPFTSDALATFTTITAFILATVITTI